MPGIFGGGGSFGSGGGGGTGFGGDNLIPKNPIGGGGSMPDFGQFGRGLEGPALGGGLQHAGGVLSDLFKKTGIPGMLGGGGGGGGLPNQVPFADALNTQMNGTPRYGVDMGGANGMQGQQQNLANALQQQSMGQGPQADLINNQLHQATQTNIASGAGQMAAQKGINPALAARMIGQNTGNLNQQAVGQGINAQLASRLGAQDQLGGVLNNMRGQEIQQQLGMGGLENQYMGNLVSGQNAQTDAAAKIAAANAARQGQIFGGLMNAGGGLLGKGLGDGFLNKTPAPSLGAAPPSSDASNNEMNTPQASLYAHGGKIPGQAQVAGDSPRNDTVDIKASPGEIIIPRSHSGSPEAAKSFIDALMKKSGKGYAEVVKKKGAAQKAKQRFDDGGMVQPDDYGIGESAAAAPAPSADQQNIGSWKNLYNTVDDAATDFGYGVKGAALTLGDELADHSPADNMRGMVKANGGITDQDRLAAQSQPAASADGTFGVLKGDQNSFGVMQADKNAPYQPGKPGANPTADTMGGYGDAFAEMQKGIQGNVAASQEYAKAAQASLQKASEDAARLHQEYQKKYTKIEADNDNLTNSIVNQKLDPNRVWSNASTGSKVAAGIGILLSGIGSGLTGQPNLAMKVIDDGISRDIDMQKAELGKKETLLSANLRKYGDMRMAEQATSAQMYAVAQGQVASAAAKMGGQQAAANGHMAMSQLKMQQAQRQHELAIWGMGNDLAGGGKGGNDLQNGMALDARFGKGMWVKTPSGAIGVGRTPKDASDVAELQTAAADFKSSIKDMRQFMETEGRTMPGTDANAVAQQKMAMMMPKINHLAGLMRMSDVDIKEILHPQIPDPGAWRQGRALKMLDGLEHEIDGKLNSEYANKLINFNPGARAARDVPTGYADGGVVKKNTDEGDVIPYAPSTDADIARRHSAPARDPYAQEVGPGAGMVRGLDKWAGEKIAEPLGGAGYPNLGAGLATAVVTPADFLLPQTGADYAGDLLPFGKLGKAAKVAEKGEEATGKVLSKEEQAARRAENNKQVMGQLKRDDIYTERLERTKNIPNEPEVKSYSDVDPHKIKVHASKNLNVTRTADSALFFKGKSPEELLDNNPSLLFDMKKANPGILEDDIMRVMQGREMSPQSKNFKSRLDLAKKDQDFAVSQLGQADSKLHSFWDDMAASHGGENWNRSKMTPYQKDMQRTLSEQRSEFDKHVPETRFDEAMQRSKSLRGKKD